MNGLNKNEVKVKKFQIEELENRLEMATISGIGAVPEADDTNNGCTKKNSGCQNGCSTSGW
jgi:hypothetical protein